MCWDCTSTGRAPQQVNTQRYKDRALPGFMALWPKGAPAPTRRSMLQRSPNSAAPRREVSIPPSSGYEVATWLLMAFWLARSASALLRVCAKSGIVPARPGPTRPPAFPHLKLPILTRRFWHPRRARSPSPGPRFPASDSKASALRASPRGGSSWVE